MTIRFQTKRWSFTWDPDKAQANLDDHGIGFFEAASCFSDPHGRDGVDEEDPSREKLIAYSEQQRLLLTVYIEVEGEVIRIISARPATRHERVKYERSGRLEESDGYRWRRNPYAAAIERFGIRILDSALPRGARSFESWKARRTRRPRE